MNLVLFFKNKLFILAILLVNLPLWASDFYEYDLAICAIFQNEAPYLQEWIEFHKLVGVKHFYLYNNLSTDDYSKVLKPYIESGEVELFEWKHMTNPDGKNWNKIQCTAYNDAIHRSENLVKWLAIIDTDEFIFPTQVDSLSEFLLDYEDVAAVSANWQMYGTSHIECIQPGHLMIEDLIYKAPTKYEENVHVKSIVRPKFVETVRNPHYCIFFPGYTQVTANKVPFSGPFTAVQVDKLRINHYWTRDENFFNINKIPRRHLWQDNACLERANNLNHEVDKAIFKYVPRLKERMRLNRQQQSIVN